jgi:solute:Na+ symporter, SSS family
MGTHVYWLFFFVLLYWGYCITIGVKGYLAAKTGTDYFIAGRSLNIWVFVLAATATSFSGWTFVGHPALIWRDGLPYGYASFYVLTIPFTGVLFLKRQWLMGKRYGYVTPGEMYQDYFNSETMRILTVIVALFFSIPYLGIQLRASGILFNILTDGLFSVNVGMWLLACVVLLYVALGGLRSVAFVDTAQCVLLWGGIIALGVISMNFAGGFDSLMAKFGDIVAWIHSGGQAVPQWAEPEAVKVFLAHKKAVFKLTPSGYSHLIAVPGVIQWVPSGGQAVGGTWTGMMVLSYMFALMGIHASPAFSMWAFANKNPKPFPLQQVWASTLGIGFALFIFTAMQGMGGWVLALWQPEGATQTILPLANLIGGKQGNLVPYLIHLMKDTAPFLVGLLAICALAAMQSTGAAYMSTASGMLTRDIIKRHIKKDMTDLQQTHYGRFMVLLVVGSALIFASVVPGAIVMLGGLAVSYGFMMYPALIAVCYWPYLTREGVVTGLVCGIIAVTLTFKFKFGLPWGAYPLTWHCAGWGILFNLPVAILVSAFTQPEEKEMQRRLSYHTFVRSHANLAPEKRHLIKIGWIITVVWFLFAIGPFCVIGNTLFGDPMNPPSWFMGMPPIWIWQILWWLAGVYMMYFLAYKCEMSTNVTTDVEVLKHDIYDKDVKGAAVES